MIGGVTMWEIIWTGGLSHLPGVSHPHLNEPLKNQKKLILSSKAQAAGNKAK